MIAIVKSNFNADITNQLLSGCTQELDSLHMDYVVFECPGAVELVSYSKLLISKIDPVSLNNSFSSIILLGAIIKGDTDHYEYVCQFVTNGVSFISAQSPIPIIFGVLTTQNDALAEERASTEKMNKGAEFAKTAAFMMQAFSV